MKLVTFDDGLVGKVVDGKVLELDVPDMRRYFELGGDVPETGREFALEDVTLRAPIIPKKFFHTAGNFREHHEESKSVNWSHPVLPWIVFFQNVDAIIGPDEPIVYPEAHDQRARLRARARRHDRQGGQVLLARGGRRLHRRLHGLQRHHRARHPARGDEVGRLLPVEEHRHLLPDRPVDRHADEIPDPHDAVDGAARQRRAPAELAHEPDVGDDPRDHQPLLGDGLQRRGHHLDRDGVGRGRVQRGRRVPVPASPATSSRPRSRASACCATRSSPGRRGIPNWSRTARR